MFPSGGSESMKHWLVKAMIFKTLRGMGRQTGTEVEEPPEERARHVIREVADEPRAGRGQGLQVHAQGVAGHDAQVRGSTASELVREGRVELDGDDLPGVAGQGKRQRTRPRADLEERLLRSGIDHAQETLDGCGAEEVLAQAARHGARRLWGVPARNRQADGTRGRSGRLWYWPPAE